MDIDIVGAGAWGTALSVCLSDNNKNSPKIILFCRTDAQTQEINKNRVNQKYFPNIKLSNQINVSAFQEYKHSAKDIAIVCIPTVFLKSFFTQNLATLSKYKKIILATKGIEQDSLQLPPNLAAACFANSGFQTPEIGIISGPSFADELILQKPAALTTSFDNIESAREISKILSRKHLRVYPNDDKIGVGLAGALKNVLALASGICDGLNLGENARAALITRGIQEIANIIVVNGGKFETVYGLAGVGDIILTCVSKKSRNYQAGLALADGTSTENVHKKIGTVEGINTATAIYKMINKLNIPSPICLTVGELVMGNIPPKKAVSMLMSRPVRESEF